MNKPTHSAPTAGGHKKNPHGSTPSSTPNKSNQPAPSAPPASSKSPPSTSSPAADFSGKVPAPPASNTFTKSHGGSQDIPPNGKSSHDLPSQPGSALSKLAQGSLGCAVGATGTIKTDIVFNPAVQGTKVAAKSAGGSVVAVGAATGARSPLGGGHYDRASVDSQFTDAEEELSFLEACVDCDDDALYEIIQNGVTWEQVNERDKSGRTGLSHACANGFMPILELLAGVEDVDPNLADNDGNTPLIFAAQAGHDDVVNFLLHHFRHVRVDQYNKLGFSALLKAAIQGRTRCAKLLLFAGANPSRRDCGRGLCAEEWARFCGCHNSADAISKYIRSKKYFFKKTFLLSKEKWNSEPDLAATRKSASGGEGGRSRDGGGSSSSGGGSWIQRHLSLKRKKPSRGEAGGSAGGRGGKLEGGASVAATNRCGSAPLLITISPASSPPSAPKTFRRPSCLDGVVACSIPRLRVTSSDQSTAGGGRASGREAGTIVEEAGPPAQAPPTITVDIEYKTEGEEEEVQSDGH